MRDLGIIYSDFREIRSVQRSGQQLFGVWPFGISVTAPGAPLHPSSSSTPHQKHHAIAMCARTTNSHTDNCFAVFFAADPRNVTTVTPPAKPMMRGQHWSAVTENNDYSSRAIFVRPGTVLRYPDQDDLATKAPAFKYGVAKIRHGRAPRPSQ